MAPAWLQTVDTDAQIPEIGTKAFNLAVLGRSGFRVPPCVFLPTFDADRLQFSSSEDYLSAVEELAERLPEILPSDSGWAVRSSATVEDLPGESHAGRFETLFISAPQDLAQAVSDVWASGASASIGPESMGVVIQVLIDADYAGVAFSSDPTRQDGSTVIEGVPGMGTRLVDGEISPWRVRPADEVANLPDGVDVGVIQAIDEGVQRLAEQTGAPVDVEWAVRGDELYWLQVRPLTGAKVHGFEIPDEQLDELSGLWVRINHSLAPQMPLVISMNPGGYFDGPGWESRLVNGFHYIRTIKKPRIELARADFDQVLSNWDETEAEFADRFDSREQIPLSTLTNEQLWEELQQRIALNQAYFTEYSDENFLHVRDRAEKTVGDYVRNAVDGDSVSTTLGRLLGRLGSKTEEKQGLLRELAMLEADESIDDVRGTEKWREFMQSYGCESATTQLFYLPTLRETPDLVLEMVRQIAMSPIERSSDDDWRSLAETIAEKLPGTESTEFMDELLLLRRCMLRTEDDDYLLARGSMLVRDTVLHAGERLIQLGTIDDTDDVFFLTGTELQSLLTVAGEADLQTRIESRKRDFALYRQLSPPPMIMNGRARTPKATSDEGFLTGTPASPGVASGIVVVLDNPFSCMGRKLPANAVVVAPIITPPLAYSLIGCAALVTETGGLASHGAIVAREMAIPAVVGVNTARSRLETGMSVTVDGSSGRITLPVNR